MPLLLEGNATPRTAPSATPTPTPPPAARQPTQQLSVEARRAAEEAQAEATLRSILEACAARRELFVDPDFPPAPRSLYANGRAWADGGSRERGSLGELSWRRPHELVVSDGDALIEGMREVFGGLVGGRSQRGSGWRIFAEGTAPSDIQQGALGNCWLLSALALLSERPELLHVVMPEASRQTNAAGAYHVRLCYGGEWRLVLVDDSLPCTRYGQPAFSRAARRQLWCALIEKAAAKLFGCYEALEAGTVEEALALLTGYPTERIDLKPRADNDGGGGGGKRGGGGAARQQARDELWARLLSLHESRFLMGASCSPKSADGQAAADALGLLTEHAYSLLGVRVVTGAPVAGGVARLVQLRNPWGRREWRGDWSDTSSMWTPSMRSALNHTPSSSDGLFWMSFDDFVDYFDRVDVCRVRPEWAEARLRVPWRLPAAAAARVEAVEVEVLETTLAEFTLLQPSARGRAGAAQPSDMLLLLLPRSGGGGGGSNGGGTTLVGASPRLMAPAVTCEALLQPGRYLALPLSLRPAFGAAPPTFVLRAGSAKPLLCERVTVAAEAAAAALCAYVRRGGECQEPLPGCRIRTLKDGAGWLTVAENGGGPMGMTVSLDFDGSFNLLPSRGSLQTYDTLPPGRTQLLQALTFSSEADGCLMRLASRFSAQLFSAEAHSPDVADALHRPVGGASGSGGALDALGRMIFGSAVR